MKGNVSVSMIELARTMVLKSSACKSEGSTDGGEKGRGSMRTSSIPMNKLIACHCLAPVLALSLYLARELRNPFSGLDTKGYIVVENLFFRDLENQLVSDVANSCTMRLDF